MAEVLHRPVVAVTSDPTGLPTRSNGNPHADIVRPRASSAARMELARDRTGKTSDDFEAYFDELKEIQRSSSLYKLRSATNGSTGSNGSQHSGSGTAGLSESDDEILKTPEGKCSKNIRIILFSIVLKINTKSYYTLFLYSVQ